MKALLRWNPEKPDFCEAKSHPKNKNSKLDICPTKCTVTVPVLRGQTKVEGAQ